MSVIGLSLGGNNIRAVELEKTRNKATLKSFGIYENVKVDLEKGSPEEMKSYVSTLSEFLAENNFQTNEVVVGLPEKQVFVRTIKIPHMDEKDLKSSIQYESEQYIPLPIQDVTLSYQIIGQDPDEKDKMEVLLVAARKDTIIQYLDIIKRVNLVPKGLEPETLSITRALAQDGYDTNAYVVLDIRKNDTLVIIVHKGFVRLTRSLAVGGETLTRVIRQGLNLDYLQAEEYKKTYGMEKDQVEGKIFDSLKPVMDNILSEVKRSKVFFTTHSPNVMINKVIVSGGTALMPGLLLYLVNNLDMEVELANPWRDIEFSQVLQDKQQYLQESGPVFVVPVGLALKEM